MFVDSDHLLGAHSAAQHVRECGALILVQSASTLTEPCCIMEVLAAIDARVPIVGVRLEGYALESAGALLTHLERSLEASAPGSAEALRQLGVPDLDDASWKLANTVPTMASIALDVHASRGMVSATMDDVVHALRTAAPVELPDKAGWLEQRSPASVPPGAHPAPIHVAQLTASVDGLSDCGEEAFSELAAELEAEALEHHLSYRTELARRLPAQHELPSMLSPPRTDRSQGIRDTPHTHARTHAHRTTRRSPLSHPVTVRRDVCRLCECRPF